MERFNFDPAYQHVSKLTLIVGSVIDMYMKNHRPFLIKYLGKLRISRHVGKNSNKYYDITDDIGQGKIYRQVKNNLNRVNSFTLVGEIDYSFDLTNPPRPSNHDGWVKVKISELDTVRDQFPFWIPKMSQDELALLPAFTAGKFKFKNALKYITLCR